MSGKQEHQCHFHVLVKLRMILALWNKVSLLVMFLLQEMVFHLQLQVARVFHLDGFGASHGSLISPVVWDNQMQHILITNLQSSSIAETLKHMIH
jgi:hypothetical protein